MPNLPNPPYQPISPVFSPLPPPPPSPHAEELPRESYFKKRYRQAWKEIDHWKKQINSEEWEIQCGTEEKAMVQQSIEHWTESIDNIVLNP